LIRTALGGSWLISVMVTQPLPTNKIFIPTAKFLAETAQLSMVNVIGFPPSNLVFGVFSPLIKEGERKLFLSEPSNSIKNPQID